jgi:hypothetical protein
VETARDEARALAAANRLRGSSAQELLAAAVMVVRVSPEPLLTADLLERLERAGLGLPAATYSGKARQLRRLLSSEQATAAGISCERGRFERPGGGRPCGERWHYLPGA